MKIASRLTTTIALVALAAFSSVQAEEESTIAFGGLLYDNWPELTRGKPPSGTHPAYPEVGTNKGRATWRCKECHGWDYMGKDGGYGPGSSSYTGIKGIRALDGAPAERVLEILKDATHAFPPDTLTDDELHALALFVAKGQIDMTRAFDTATRKATGDADKGAGYFNTVCAKCHGTDGTQPKDMEETLGALAARVPGEVLHKIRNGDPAPEMPALRAFPDQIGIDILAHIQTLPLKR